MSSVKASERGREVSTNNINFHSILEKAILYKNYKGKKELFDIAYKLWNEAILDFKTELPEGIQCIVITDGVGKDSHTVLSLTGPMSSLSDTLIQQFCELKMRAKVVDNCRKEKIIAKSTCWDLIPNTVAEAIKEYKRNGSLIAYEGIWFQFFTNLGAVNLTQSKVHKFLDRILLSEKTDLVSDHLSIEIEPETTQQCKKKMWDILTFFLETGFKLKTRDIFDSEDMLKDEYFLYGGKYVCKYDLNNGRYYYERRFDYQP